MLGCVFQGLKSWEPEGETVIHHTAIAVKDPDKAHEFYTKAMGFELVKIVKRLAPAAVWTKHIFYDTGNGELFPRSSTSAGWKTRASLIPTRGEAACRRLPVCPIGSITSRSGAMAQTTSN